MGKILINSGTYNPLRDTQNLILLEREWVTDTYTTPGVYSMSITGANFDYIEVECWAPGAHGQNITIGTKAGGSGGAGGGYSKSYIVNGEWNYGAYNFSGNTLYWRVAEGGTTDSDYLTLVSFSSPEEDVLGPYTCCAAFTRGAGNGRGNIVYSGGTGASAFNNSNYGGYEYRIGGGGGEGASPSGDGNNAPGIGTGPGQDDPDSVNAGRGGSGTDGADGGDGRQGIVRDVVVEGAGNGDAGTSPGGGGGGCYADGTATRLGGAGGNGQVKISYYK